MVTWQYLSGVLFVVKMDVVYFISPSSDSVTRLMEDFRGQPAYGSVHIFFLSKAGPEVMTMLQGSPKLISRIKTFKEVTWQAVWPVGCVSYSFSGTRASTGSLLANLDRPTAPPWLCHESAEATSLAPLITLHAAAAVRAPLPSRGGPR